jgi:hypothetical protein
LQQWRAQGNRGGESLSLAQVWELSRRWYTNRLSVDFHGRSVAQVEEIFRSLNLASEFWYMNPPSEIGSR